MGERPDRDIRHRLRRYVANGSPGDQPRDSGPVKADRGIPGPGCVDPGIGRHLLAYSLDRLPASTEVEFEAHMLACDHCFDALRGLDQIASALRVFISELSDSRKG
jgi:hypothetical protein